MELDDGHGESDGHKKMDQVLHIWKRRKRKTKKTKIIKAKVYDRFLFCTQDTKEGVSDLGSIAIL